MKKNSLMLLTGMILPTLAGSGYLPDGESMVCTDGTQSVFPLILPETLAPSNAKLVDTWQMPCGTAHRERGSIGNAYTDIVYMPIDPKKELKRVTLETWSNETVIGLKSLAIGR